MNVDTLSNYIKFFCSSIISFIFLFNYYYIWTFFFCWIICGGQVGELWPSPPFLHVTEYIFSLSMSVENVERFFQVRHDQLSNKNPPDTPPSFFVSLQLFFFFFFIVTCLNLCMYEIIYFTRCKKFFSSLFWRRVGTWAMEKVALETMKRQSYHIYRISHANHEAPFEYILA